MRKLVAPAGHSRLRGPPAQSAPTAREVERVVDSSDKTAIDRIVEYYYDNPV